MHESIFRPLLITNPSKQALPFSHLMKDIFNPTGEWIYPEEQGIYSTRRENGFFELCQAS